MRTVIADNGDCRCDQCAEARRTGEAQPPAPVVASRLGEVLADHLPRVGRAVSGFFASRPQAAGGDGNVSARDPERMREFLARRRPAALQRSGPAPWYSIGNVSNASAEIFIYDEIGYWGTTADDFVRELTALNVDEISIRLNTPGGDAWDGIAIYNALRTHRARVTVYVDALAASAGSVIAMAGDRVVMRRASRMMIHDAASLVYGDAAFLREYADLLEAISEDIARTYLARAGGEFEEWRERMRAETWLSADEAVALGLADECDPERDGPGDDDQPDTSVVPGGDDDEGDPLARWVNPLAAVPAINNEVKWDADAIRTILRGETVA